MGVVGCGRGEYFDGVRLGLEAEWVVVDGGGDEGDCVLEGWVRVPVGGGLYGVKYLDEGLCWRGELVRPRSR